MSEKCIKLLSRSFVRNYIPSGRQLPRTPPLLDVKRHLDFSETDVDFQNELENTEVGTTHQDENSGVLGCSHLKMFEDAPHSMLKGMKGYQLTPGDLEFMKTMREEQLIKKLQGELKEVQMLLSNEMFALEMACASREKAQAELRKVPSCEELAEWVKVVLSLTSPLAELTDMSTKSLLSLVTMENIQTVMKEKLNDLTRMKMMLGKKRKQEAEERRKLEKQIASKELKIQGLMRQLSELSQQEEAYKALEMQANTHKAPGDDLEDTQATKSKVKHSGREMGMTQETKDTAIKAKTTRRKRTDDRTSVKNDRSAKNKSAALEKATEEEPKQKSGATSERLTRPIKAARGKQKKVEERELHSRESEQAVGGKQKPAGTAQATASQAKHQSKVNAGKAQSASQQTVASRSRKKAAVAAGDAGEEAQNASLRRSKRIASRK